MRSWYKTSMESLSVEQLATQVRNSLSHDDDDSLTALCLPVSRHLAQVLITNGYSAAAVIQGTFTVDTPDPEATSDWDVADFGDDYEMMEEATYTPLHYWVQLNNTVVDITADQFNDELEDPVPEVTIGDINALERYTVITEDFVESKIMYE